MGPYRPLRRRSPRASRMFRAVRPGERGSFEERVEIAFGGERGCRLRIDQEERDKCEDNERAALR